MLLIRQRPAQQGFGAAFYGGERGFELVRNVGHEIFAQVLEFAGAGDVPGHQHAAAHGAVLHYGRGGHAQHRAGGGGRFEFQLHWLAAGQGLYSGRGKLRPAGHAGQPHTFRLETFDAHELAGARIYAGYDAAAVGDHYRLGHVAEGGFQLQAAQFGLAHFQCHLFGHEIERLGKFFEFPGGAYRDAVAEIPRGEAFGAGYDLAELAAQQQPERREELQAFSPSNR